MYSRGSTAHTSTPAASGGGHFGGGGALPLPMLMTQPDPQRQSASIETHAEKVLRSMCRSPTVNEMAFSVPRYARHPRAGGGIVAVDSLPAAKVSKPDHPIWQIRAPIEWAA
jgi:hypothetical protein